MAMLKVLQFDNVGMKSEPIWKPEMQIKTIWSSLIASIDMKRKELCSYPLTDKVNDNIAAGDQPPQ